MTSERLKRLVVRTGKWAVVGTVAMSAWALLLALREGGGPSEALAFATRMLPLTVGIGAVTGGVMSRWLDRHARGLLRAWRRRGGVGWEALGAGGAPVLSDLETQAWVGLVDRMWRRRAGWGVVRLAFLAATIWSSLRLADWLYPGAGDSGLVLLTVVFVSSATVLRSFTGDRSAAQGAADALERWLPGLRLVEERGHSRILQLPGGAEFEVRIGGGLVLVLDLRAMPLRALALVDGDQHAVGHVAEPLGDSGFARSVVLEAGSDADGLPLGAWLDSESRGLLLAALRAGGEVHSGSLHLPVVLNRDTPQASAQACEVLDRLSRHVQARAALGPVARVLAAVSTGTEREQVLLLQAVTATVHGKSTLVAVVQEQRVSASTRGHAWFLWAGLGDPDAQARLRGAIDERDLGLLRGVLGAVPQHSPVNSAFSATLAEVRAVVDAVAQAAVGALAVAEPGEAGQLAVVSAGAEAGLTLSSD